MKKDENVIDVIYTHTEDEFIPRFLMSDVEKELDETHSTIKYWLRKYGIEDYINRTNQGKDRYFSVSDIQLLRKIKILLRQNKVRSQDIPKEIKEEMTKLKEVRYYLEKNKNTKNENEYDDDEEETQLQISNQPNIDQIANAIKESLLQDIAVLIKDNQLQMENNITEKMSKQLEIKKDEIIKELSVSMSENKESIENTIQDTVKTSSDVIKTTLTDSESKLSTTINNGLESNLKRFKSYGDELEQKFSNRDEDNMAKLRESMEKQAEKNRLLEIEQREEKKKGFLDKISGIFGK